MTSRRLRSTGPRSSSPRLPPRKPRRTRRPSGASTATLSANAGAPSVSITRCTASPTRLANGPSEVSMPTSRPRALACSSFPAVRDVPRTVAPMAWASCAAAVPTPLPTVWMRTRSPRFKRPRTVRASKAVRNASGTAAASPKSSAAGIGSTSSSGTTSSSACAPPPAMPMTRSPGAQRDPAPADSISPAYSRPGTSAGHPGGA